MTTKLHLKVKPNNHQNKATLRAAISPDAPVNLVNTAAGAVSFLDKVKAYYKQIIIVVTTVLSVANELTPFLNFLPGQDKHYVTVAISVIGTVLAVLKSNEQWVDDL